MTVVVVGAGPVGVLLAAELSRHGTPVRLLERRTTLRSGSRAVGVHATALAAMEASGVTERLLAEARLVREGEARSRGRSLGVVRFDRLAMRHPYVATLPQSATEAALADAARAWGAPEAETGSEVRAIRVDGAHPRVELVGGATLSATAVVVAGGGRARSLHPTRARVRAYPDRYLMTDAADAGPDGDRAVVHLDPSGVLESFPLPGGRRRYVAWMPTLTGDGPAESRDPAADGARLREAVARRTGSAAAADAVTVASAFGVRRAVVATPRVGSVLAIGDAAHEVSPIGGQGMNLGLIDAVTLAPLLSRWVREGEPPAGLDRWVRERRRAALRSARIAALNTRLGRPFTLAVRPTAVRAALALPTERLLTHAYAMGFDPAASGFRTAR
ncbi:2-polyprenyl-6-methoxyphenol hydroxylase-like FAD-dependent oxidoreductase [Microbacterium telephonicum]|uniref:2-polyprenyl-6-methoxyphenol hydroxylase-like FAD-dependent oxidoreductase n=1 Tax=Microbacterium telephonicum TaxID=1714841 RepID=A0A498C174_9MICO|nr:NAD(P)/FAD-dependent oxidoreductase [Microbacterium telephonicum]RLK46608.1 2-polyprenyl-6-methoxyphenol hydroxylase-like FAD-dependent oxidoreductase [Microbacterium telephonicum]